MLDVRDFHQLSDSFYEKGLYLDKNYNRSGLAAWEEAVVRRFFEGRDTILVAAAGGGREAVELVGRGHRVFAFDCVPVLVETCRAALRENPPSEVSLSQPDRVPDYDIRFDGVVVGWGGYMHIPTRRRRLIFLRQLRRLLPAGAPLLLSFFVRAGDSRRFRYIQKIGAFFRRIRRANTDLEVGDMLNGTFDHYFTEQEIREELEAAGFEIAEFRSRPYGHSVAVAV